MRAIHRFTPPLPSPPVALVSKWSPPQPTARTIQQRLHQLKVLDQILRQNHTLDLRNELRFKAAIHVRQPLDQAPVRRERSPPDARD